MRFLNSYVVLLVLLPFLWAIFCMFFSDVVVAIIHFFFIVMLVQQHNIITLNFHFSSLSASKASDSYASAIGSNLQ